MRIGAVESFVHFYPPLDMQDWLERTDRLISAELIRPNTNASSRGIHHQEMLLMADSST